MLLFSDSSQAAQEVYTVFLTSLCIGDTEDNQHSHTGQHTRSVWKGVGAAVG